MARKRMIDPAIWNSEDFSKLTMLSRLIWIGLISNADDEGRGKANISYIKSQLFPYDDDLSLKKIEASLKEISRVMSILFYEVDCKKYYQLKNWNKFQTINRPSPSQIPLYSEENDILLKKQFIEHSVSTHEQVIDNSLPKKEIEYKYNNKEENIKEESNLNSLPQHIQKNRYGSYKNVLLTKDEYLRLIAEPNGSEAIEYLSEYREMKGYKCKNDNLAIRKWAFSAVREQQQKENRLSNVNSIKPKLSTHNYTKEQLDNLFDNVGDVQL